MTKHFLMHFIFSFILLLLLAACQPQPQARFDLGGLLLREPFESAVGWDSFIQGNVSAGVEAGAYRMQADVNTYVRGFNSTPYADVVIDVQGIQLSAQPNNAYGVVCRGAANNTANGYYFLIGGDGSYSIRKGQFGEVDALVHWAKSDAIARGTALNNLRVVCVEDYLALYVNGQFVADARDTTFSTGFIGFAVAARRGTRIEAAFDDLIIHEGVLSGD